MSEWDYLELLDFVRRWEKRHPMDKTPLGYQVVEQSKQKIKEYENNANNHRPANHYHRIVH